MALSNVAVVALGPEDANQVPGLPLPNINCVNDVVKAEGDHQYTMAQYVERYVWNIVRRCKQRRLALEQEWLAISRMVVLEHDEGRKYMGRSNAYLPVYARSRKTIVSSLCRGLFPSDDFMDVVDREQGDTEAAKACKAVIEYEFDQSGLRRTVKAFLGQFSDFGVSCMKAWYRSKPQGKVNAQQMASVIPSKANGYDEGVTISTRSMFNVVVYPEWAESKRELQLEAERLEVPIAFVTAQARSKRWLNVDQALATRGQWSDEFDWVNQSVLSSTADIANNFELRGEDGSPVESCICVEAWTSMRLPKDQYGPDEDPTLPVPAQVVFINGVAVMVRRNPFSHGCSPFVYARDNQVAGSFYSDGSGRLTRSLQYLVNDSANQLNDCASYTMNPVSMVNTNYFVGTPGPLAPGRTYKGRDIDKMMKFERPPVEMLQHGNAHLGTLTTMAQDASGALPVLQGSKSANTATGTQVLQNNASGPLQDAVEDIEADAMVPLMEMTWELSRQYRSEPFFQEMGKKPMIDPMTGQAVIDPQTGQPQMVPDIAQFLPKDIDVKPRFKFLSSSQAQNRMQRQQGLTVFADLAGKLGQNLQMQGKMLNAEEVLRRAWSDGMGNRNFQKVVIPMPMAPQPQQAGPGQPGPGQGGPGPGGLPPVSAVPQGNVPGAGQNEPAMGEDVRGPRMPVEAATGQPVVAQAPPGMGSPGGLGMDVGIY